jgi:hypothetical protein
MWQTNYALAVPKHLGLGLNFRLCSEGYFLSGRPLSVIKTKHFHEMAKVLTQNEFLFARKVCHV